ncbi:MAG: DUF726 domain-containing protein, partial [Planctomycetota bacterium]
VGDSCLLVWMSGRWRDSAAVAGLRAAYRAARFRYLLSPASLAIDAGVIGAHEVAQFKWMERRAERVGAELPALVEPIADGRPVNLVGHSLGARVIHHALRAAKGGSGPAWRDAVLLAGAADLDAEDWPDCVARLSGRLTNVYDRRDRVLRLTPDLRRRVGVRAMPQVLVDGEPRVVNHHAEGVGHVAHWTRLAAGLREAWPAGFAVASVGE